MTYQFPVIRHINDVLPHIENFKEINFMPKGEIGVIDYMIDTHDTFSRSIEGWEFRRECRGLIFDADGNLISRPFHKFFNVNQLEETQDSLIDYDRKHRIMVKEDGSMVRPVILKNAIRWATRKGFTQTVDSIYTHLPEYCSYGENAAIIKKILKSGKTPCFEYVGPTNQHIVKYDRPRLILLAIRDNLTGDYEDIYVDEYSGLDRVGLWESPKSFDELMVTVKSLVGQEGVVLTFGNEYYKIKGEDYFIKHRLRDEVSNPRHVCRASLSGSLDDMLPNLTERDREIAVDTDKKLLKLFEKVVEVVEQKSDELIEKYKTKKDFALSREDVDVLIKKTVFAKFDGKTTEFMVNQHIAAQTHADNKFNAMIEYFKNLTGMEFVLDTVFG